MDLFGRQAMEVDIIVTTAQIPGKPAPKLITAGMIESMTDGGVIVDLAAEQGGNCDLTVPGEVVEYSGVTIIGLHRPAEPDADPVEPALCDQRPAPAGGTHASEGWTRRNRHGRRRDSRRYCRSRRRHNVAATAESAVAATRAGRTSGRTRLLAKPVLPSAARAPKKSGPIKASSAALLLTLAAIALAASVAPHRRRSCSI
jgi:hypothetical protein